MGDAVWIGMVGGLLMAMACAAWLEGGRLSAAMVRAPAGHMPHCALDSTDFSRDQRLNFNQRGLVGVREELSLTNQQLPRRKPARMRANLRNWWG